MQATKTIGIIYYWTNALISMFGNAFALLTLGVNMYLCHILNSRFCDCAFLLIRKV